MLDPRHTVVTSESQPLRWERATGAPTQGLSLGCHDERHLVDANMMVASFLQQHLCWKHLVSAGWGDRA